MINELAPIYESGLRLGDELLEFEGVPIENANQFTNLICTLPEDWPAQLEIMSEEGERKSIHSRLLGLPYSKPKPPKLNRDDDDSEEQKKKIKRRYEMIKLLRAPPGTIRHPDVNRHYAEYFLNSWGLVEHSKKQDATQDG